MPVVPVTRFILRGRIRAQAQYTAKILNRLLTANAKNPELGIFLFGDVPGSALQAAAIVTQLEFALTARG